MKIFEIPFDNHDLLKRELPGVLLLFWKMLLFILYPISLLHFSSTCQLYFSQSQHNLVQIFSEILFFLKISEYISCFWVKEFFESLPPLLDQFSLLFLKLCDPIIYLMLRQTQISWGLVTDQTSCIFQNLFVDVPGVHHLTLRK